MNEIFKSRNTDRLTCEKYKSGKSKTQPSHFWVMVPKSYGSNI